MSERRRVVAEQMWLLAHIAEGINDNLSGAAAGPDSEVQVDIKGQC